MPTPASSEMRSMGKNSPGRYRVLTTWGLPGVMLCAAMFPLMGDGYADAPTPIVGQLVDPIALRGVEDVHLEGNTVFLPCREGERLTVCTIEDPENPKVLSTFTHQELGPAAGLAFHDGRAYVTSQSNGKLLVIDASDPTSLHLLGDVAIGDGPLYKVAYRGGYCYVAHQGGKRLAVVDVQDPRRPVVVSSVTVTAGNDGPFSVTLHGDIALIGTIFGTQNRLSVVSIEQPQSPRLVNELVGPRVGHASGEISGSLFYAVNWAENAFLVIDVSDITRPRVVAALVDERLGKPNRCVLAGNRAYLPMVEGHGIAVVDISDPLAPTFLGAYRNPVLKKTYGAAVQGPLLVVGAREGNSLVLLNRAALEPQR